MNTLKKLFILILFSVHLIVGGGLFDISDNKLFTYLEEYKKQKNFEYSYSFAVLQNEPKYATNIANYILDNCSRFNIDAQIFTRLVYQESEFIHWKKSRLHDETGKKWVRDAKGRPITIAYGLSMVHLKFWAHKLYDQTLFPELKGKLKSQRDIERYIMVPKYNIRLGCYILNYYLKKNEWDYKLALTAYWAGQNSRQYRNLKYRNKSNYYADGIYEAQNIHRKANRFYDWKNPI